MKNFSNTSWNNQLSGKSKSNEIIKMTEQEFTEQKEALLLELEELKKGINQRYTKLTHDFVKEVSPVKEGKVYELIENGIKRKGFTRFVVYTHDISFLDKYPMIRVGGWWLDKNNVPAKWDVMTVYGVSNTAKFILSEDQTACDHPDINKQNVPGSEGEHRTVSAIVT